MFLKTLLLLLTVHSVVSFTLTDFDHAAERVALHPRIIGGTEVRDRCSAPYNSMAAIRVTPSPGQSVVVCSAIMLTADVLVTSGYCMYGFVGQTNVVAEIVIGEWDLVMENEPYQKVIAIDSFKIHPQYNHDSLDNNIALIRLAESAEFSACVQPAVAMETDLSACTDIDRSCIMVGWGPRAETSQPINSKLPLQANLTVYGDLISSILSQQKRQSDQPIGSLLAETMHENVKACHLDWGGIVSCLRNGHRVLKGLIGDHNCNSASDPPIVVTDVTYFQNWIDRCVLNWDTCQALSR